MAKRGILTHPKTLRLAERLGIAECYAVGIMECLWQWVAEYAPTGDLSDCSAREIGRAIGFRGKPEPLLAALVAVRLLDDLGSGKLVVHDWADHAPDYVHMRLARSKRVFATGAAPSLARLPRREREEIEKATGLADSVRTRSAQEALPVRTLSAPPEPGQNQARPEPGQIPPSPPGGSGEAVTAEAPANGNGHHGSRGPGAATERERARLEADPVLASLADAWAQHRGKTGRELGVLRAAAKAVAGGYAPDDLVLVSRLVALAGRQPERFHDRGSIRWAAQNNPAASYVWRPDALDKLTAEAEAWERA